MNSIVSTSDVVENTLTFDDISGSVECVVPMYTHDGSETDFLGLVIIADAEVSVRYYTRQGWEVVGTYQYKSSPIITKKHSLDSEVYFFGNDAVIVEYLVKRLVNLIEENWNIKFELFTDELRYSTIKDAQEICSCKSIHDDTIKETVTLSSTTTTFILRCDKCLSPIGVETNETSEPLNRIFNESWLTTNSSLDECGEITLSPKSKIIYTDGEAPEKINKIVSVLGDKAIFEMDIAERYDPTKHKVALYIHNNTIVGYLIWEEIQGKNIIHQVYIRERYRRRGFGQSLIEVWRDKIVQSDSFNIMIANNVMRQLLESIIPGESGDELIKKHRCYKLTGAGDKYESLNILNE